MPIERVVAGWLLCTTLAVSWAGCATGASARAAKVRVIPAEEAKSCCEFIARVSGSSSLTGVARQTGYDNALNELLDNAAALGAEFVVLEQDSGPSYWTTSEVVRGEAFKRKAPAQ